MGEPDYDEFVAGETFWLQRGREMIVASLERRDAAARQLMNTLAWLWAAYTGAAVVSTALADTALSATSAVIVSIPSVALVVAYLLATWASMPVVVEFDPRVPMSIEAEHARAVGIKSRRLICASIATAIAGIAVAASVTAVALSGSDGTRPAKASPLSSAIGPAELAAPAHG